MDQQKIIHLAGEALVIGGVFIFLNKQYEHKIKTVQAEKSNDFLYADSVSRTI